MKNDLISSNNHSPVQLELIKEPSIMQQLRSARFPHKERIPSISSSFKSGNSLVLHHGDAHSFLKSIPSKTVKLIISSPPYNLGKQYETKTELQSYLASQKPIINELVRILRDDGSICWEVGNYVCDSEVYPLDIFYYDFFKEQGLKLRNRIIWHFEHGLHASKRFSGRYETILWFTKTDKYTFNLDSVRVPSKYPGKKHYKGPNHGKLSGNPLGKNPSDFWQTIQSDWEKMIWNIPNVKANHPEKTIHPCQFPIELVERCVLALTNPGDWVFDPYAGVGSTLVAAVKNERKAMGCEKMKSYLVTAQQRLLNFFRGNLKIRPLGKPVHQPSGRDKASRVPQEWKKYLSKRKLISEELEKIIV